MYKYIVKRILLMVPTLIGAAMLVFFLLRLIPGDVCELRLAGTGLYADPAEIELCRTNLGLNDHIMVQFADFVLGFFILDLGESMWTGKAITFEIGLRFQLSLQVAFMATFVAVIISIPLGVISAVKQDTWIDYVVRSFSIFGIAIPSFWLGIMIILGLLISTQALLGEPWMPPIWYVSPCEDLGANMAQAFAGLRKDEILYTLNAMTSLAEHLNRTFDVPGPKTMIMVSAGISQNPGSTYYYILDTRLDQAAWQVRSNVSSAAEHPVAFRPPYAQTIDAYMMRAVGHLNRMNYTLYTIGARGTTIGAFADGTDRFRSNLSPGIASIAYRDEEAGLRMLSRGTGGLAFHNSANFYRAFEQIDYDTAFRYVLGYAPPERAENANPNKFYRIQVKVDRDNVTVRARRGYVDG